MRKIDLSAERNYENLKTNNPNQRKAQDKYYWAVDLPIQEHLRNTLSRIKSGVVLEVGCSKGTDSQLYSPLCSEYIGVDISDEAIKVASSLCLTNAQFYCTDGHKLPFDAETFDFVIVNSLLHHLDLKLSLPEIYRVLKPSGEIVFREPLGINPLMQFYRYMTPKSRTPDEKPFDKDDYYLLNKYFVLHDVSWYGFFNLISGHIRINSLRIILTFLDRLLATTPLRYLFWQFSGFGTKRPSIPSEN